MSMAFKSKADFTVREIYFSVPIFRKVRPFFFRVCLRRQQNNNRQDSVMTEIELQGNASRYISRQSARQSNSQCNGSQIMFAGSLPPFPRKTQQKALVSLMIRLCNVQGHLFRVATQ